MAILALQRMHGNRTVGRLLAGAKHPTSRPLRGPATTIQRVANLADTHKHILTDGTPEQKNMLKDFQTIQALLNDAATVTTYLKALSDNFDYWGYLWPNLDYELKKYEADYAAARPILIGSAGGAFTRVLNRKQLFNDLVAKPHGVFTHRLQWFIIGQDIKAKPGAWHNPAHVLYRAASLEAWRMPPKGSYMWELVLDRTDRKIPTDFTTPDNLEAYIIAHRSDFPNLTDEVVKSSNTQRSDKKTYREAYQTSDHYNQMLEDEDKKVDRDHQVQVGTQLFTGFLLNGWSETEPPLNTMYLPTVVYLNGDSPDARGKA